MFGDVEREVDFKDIRFTVRNDIQVPVRLQQVYQTDDGRRIEVMTKKMTIPFIHQSVGGDENELPEFTGEFDTIYIGIIVVPTNRGPKEIKFHIPGAKTLEEAFAQYYEFGYPAIEELQKRVKEAQQETENRIVRAPAGILDAFDEEQKQGGNVIVP